MPTWLLQETQRVVLGFGSAVFGIVGCSLSRRAWDMDLPLVRCQVEQEVGDTLGAVRHDGVLLRVHGGRPSSAVVSRRPSFA